MAIRTVVLVVILASLFTSPQPQLAATFLVSSSAKRVGFDPTFSVRRVATLCPDFPNPFNTTWCEGHGQYLPLPGSFYSSFLDPSPIPNVDPFGSHLEHGFYSLTVKTGGTSPSPQVCKVNSPDCGFQFAWENSDGMQAHLTVDASMVTFPSLGWTKPSAYYSFGTRTLDQNTALYTGAWYSPPQRSAGLHVKVAGKILATDGNPNARTRYLILARLDSPSTGNSYELDINLGHYGAPNPSGGYDDAWSATEKYALIRTTPETRGFYREIYIGAGGWGLPILDLSTGDFQTYDIDFSSLWQQMVQDQVIDPADLQFNINDPHILDKYRDMNFFGEDVQFGIETQGGIKTDLLIKEFAMYDLSSTATSNTTTTTTTPSSTFTSTQRSNETTTSSITTSFPTTSVATQPTSTLTTLTGPNIPGVPGFSLESIVSGLLIGIIAVAVLRHRRRGR